MKERFVDTNENVKLDLEKIIDVFCQKHLKKILIKMPGGQN